MTTESKNILLEIPEDLKDFLDVPKSSEHFYSAYLEFDLAVHDPNTWEYKRHFYPRYYLAIKKNTKEEAQEALFADIRKLKELGIKPVAQTCQPSAMPLAPSPEIPTSGGWVALYFPYLDLMPDLADQYAESINRLKETLGSAASEGQIAGQ